MAIGVQRGGENALAYRQPLALVWAADAKAPDNGIFSAAGFLAAALSGGILLLGIDGGIRVC